MPRGVVPFALTAGGYCSDLWRISKPEAQNMFWLMNAELVIGTRNNELELINARTCRARKGLMEVLTGRTWPYHGMDHSALKTQECVLRKFWLEHVSDRSGRRDEIPPNTLAVPKTVFSYAMTIMDKVDGWIEEKWVGSIFAA